MNVLGYFFFEKNDFDSVVASYLDLPFGIIDICCSLYNIPDAMLIYRFYSVPDKTEHVYKYSNIQSTIQVCHNKK